MPSNVEIYYTFIFIIMSDDNESFAISSSEISSKYDVAIITLHCLLSYTIRPNSDSDNTGSLFMRDIISIFRGQLPFLSDNIPCTKSQRFASCNLHTVNTHLLRYLSNNRILGGHAIESK
jgi:hypothetical protein